MQWYLHSSLHNSSFAMQWYISFSRSFKIVASMDLVSMVVNNKEPMKIILLTYFEIESTDIEFDMYRKNCEPVIGEVLKRCIWSHRTKSISMQWRLLIMKTMFFVLYQKGKVEKMRKHYFTF